LQRSPRPSSWILGALLLREGEREGRGRKGKGRKGRDGTPKGLVDTPMLQILKNTLTVMLAIAPGNETEWA